MTDEQAIRDVFTQMHAPVDGTRKAAGVRAIEEASGAMPRRWRVRAPLLTVAVVGGLMLTPPGQAVAGFVGHLVGVGDETEITESNLRDPRLTDQQERIGPAIVTAKGTVPVVDEPFEILAWGAKYIRDPKAPEGIGDPTQTGEIVSCMGAFYPEIGEQYVGSICVGPEQPPPHFHVLGYGGAVPGTDYTGADREQPYQVIGDTALDVDRIVVTFKDAEGQDQEVDATVGTVDDEVLQETGAEKPFSFFVALLPYDGAKRGFRSGDVPPTLASAKVIAYDAAGEVVATYDIGEQYQRNLHQDARLQKQLSEQNTELATGAQLAICLKFGARVLDQSVCKKADAAATRHAIIRSEGRQFQERIRLEGDVATIDLPGGAKPVVLALKPLN